MRIPFWALKIDERFLSTAGDRRVSPPSFGAIVAVGSVLVSLLHPMSRGVGATLGLPAMVVAKLGLMICTI